MLNDPVAADTDLCLDEDTSGPTLSAARPASAGVVAVRLAEALAVTDVIYIASDEQRGVAVATALSAAAHDALILHIPSSDALPGDAGPASPANVGRRVAALHRLRLTRDKGRTLVTSADAATRLYPRRTGSGATERTPMQ